MSSIYEFEHAQGAELDYGFDWTKALKVGEVVVSSDWVFPAGITKGVEFNNGFITTVFVVGGVAGKLYKITNIITTSSTPARKDSRTINIVCVNR